MTDTEVWKPVPGYEVAYEASSEGAVRSLPRTTNYGRKIAGRTLTQRKTHDGYLRVGLSLGGIVKTVQVHRIVLAAFAGQCPAGEVGCHIDGNPSNNRLSNLRWGTQGSNRADTVRHGTDFHASKSECPNGHPLEHPNLVLGHLKRGRKCLACNRARGYAHHRKIEFTKELADSYFLDITHQLA